MRKVKELTKYCVYEILLREKRRREVIVDIKIILMVFSGYGMNLICWRKDPLTLMFNTAMEIPSP
jgi:hypothetical protein